MDNWDGARTIKLTQGKVALVDKQDFDRVSKLKWSARKEGNSWYAKRNTSMKLGKCKTLHLHRFIMNPPNDLEVDHINRDGLDCRRVNMRLATPTQNQHNSRLRSDNTSGYKGVQWNKKCKKWQAGITINSKFVYLGVHTTREEAALAYDKAAQKNFGEYARLNFG